MKVRVTTGCDSKRLVQQQDSNIKNVTGGHATNNVHVGGVKQFSDINSSSR